MSDGGLCPAARGQEVDAGVVWLHDVLVWFI